MAGFLSNPGNLLQALGAGLLTAGARPEDRSQVGMQALGNFQNMMMDQRRQKERDFLLNLEISDRARANQEREEAKRKQQEQEQAYKALLGGQAPANGLSQAQFGGAPQTTGPMGNMSDVQRQFLQAAGPQAGLGIIGQQLFKEPAGANSSIAKAGQDLMNGLIDKPTYDAIVKKETYISPPAQGPVTWSDIPGPDGKPLGQRSSTGQVNYFSNVPGSENPLGNSFDANAINLLVTGDPSSPIYAATYNQVAQPKVQFDMATGQTITIKPDMSAYRPPATQSGQPTVAAPSSFSDAGLANQQPGTSPANGAVTVDQTITPGLAPTAKAKVIDAKIDAESIIKAVDDYAAAYAGAGVGDRAIALSGAGSELNTKYNTAALLSKAESLFNLGVLNGPDLDIIRRTLTDPSTAGSVITSPDAVKEQAKVIKDLVKQRLNAREREYGLPLTVFPESTPEDSSAIEFVRDANGRLVRKKQ